MIKLITKVEAQAIMNRYFDKKSLPEDKGLFICFEDNKYLALDNKSGDCYVELFNSLVLALDYLLDNYESLELLYFLNETFRESNIRYITEIIDVPRRIKFKNKSKTKKLISFGFNKSFRPDLEEEYIKKIIDILNNKMEE